MIDRDALAHDAAALVRVPSVTGDERAVLERLGELAAGHGLEAELHVHDLAALRAHPGHPGEEAPRTELCGLTVTLPGERPGRVCLNGHIDVVGPGGETWERRSVVGRVEDGWLHGRGSVDMKGGVVAALHALLALRAAPEPAPTVVLQAVASEEDGGLGTFAALERDAAFDACLIPEPTALRRRLRAGGRAHLPGDGPRARGARRDAARGPLGARPLPRRAPRAAGARARAQPRRRPSRDAGARAALSAQRRAHRGRASGRARSPTASTFEGRLGVPLGAPLEDAAPRFEAVLDDGEAPAWRSSGPAASSPRRDRPGASVGARRDGRGARRARARRGWRACPTAPTCGSSARAASRP